MDEYRNRSRDASVLGLYKAELDMYPVVLRDVKKYGVRELSFPDFAASCALAAYDNERINIPGAKNLTQREFLANYFYQLEEILSHQTAVVV